MSYCKRKILFVDDDPDDRLFLSEAIGKADPEVDVVEAENGVAALEYLNEAKTHFGELPCLIVLDLNMPMLDGKQIFERLKQDPVLQTIPVVVYTSSENPNDKNLFRNLGVALMSKPDNIAYMSRIASNLLSYCS